MEAGSVRYRLINLVAEHSIALSHHIERLCTKQPSDQSPIRRLLDCLSESTDCISERLKELGSDEDFRSLEDKEAEQKILRYSQLCNYFSSVIFSFVQSIEGSPTLVELVRPLQRLMRPSLSDFHLILHPLPNLNYTFYPLGRELAALVNSVGFVTPTIRNLPEQLTAIGFPSLEAEHFLNHCTIGHELGHCLYLKRNCEQELMPRVQLNAQELNDLVKNLAEARIFTGSSEQPERQPTLSEYFSEVEIGSSVTKEINDYCASWLKELTCDAIAYRLLGPSYLFADLNFLTSLTSFDGDESKTHPPNRMRFKLLYTMLDLEHPLDNKSASTEIFDTNVIDFLRFWKDVTFSKEPSFTNPIRRLAGNAILNMYSDIISTATSVVAEIGSYDLFKHVQEVQKLNKRIKMFAPPNELIEDGEVKEAKFQSILNVGWLAYIGQLKTIAKKYGWQLNKCKEKVNDLIAKAVELNEIQRRWKELQQ